MENKTIEAEEINEPQTQYDDNGNVSYIKDPDGVETWFTRNEAGKLLTVKNSNGYFLERELDEYGNCIHQKGSDGYEYWVTCLPDGIPCSFKDNEGFEESYTYNDAGDILRYENSQGEWEDFTYNDRGQVTSAKCQDGFESHNEYDDEGNVTRRWTTDGEEEITTKLENGNYLRIFTMANGDREQFELDPEGRPVHFKNDDIEEWMVRNEQGFVINFRNSKGLDVSYEVDEAGQILNETINSEPEETTQED